jgi:hypothetical protein
VPNHKTGTHEEWLAARLKRLETEKARRNGSGDSLIDRPAPSLATCDFASRCF